MSEEKSRTASERSTAKKAAVLGAGNEKKSRLSLFAAGGVVALLALAAFFFLGRRGGDAVAVAAAPTAAVGAEAVLPAAPFDDGQARFYSLDVQGLAVRYFAVKGADGAIHTAFDACDACWAAGKGYKQAGDAMTCQNCRRQFAITEIGQQHGGCNPAPLASELRGGNLVIRTADVEAGRHYFDLPKGG